MNTQSRTNFKPGTKYLSNTKHPRLYTVTDVHVTSNLAGEIVSTRYVATHDFLGQIVTARDVLHTTIAIGHEKYLKTCAM